MATVKGPLFSIGASGTLGGAIVFSTWKGRPYVRQHAVPSNPKAVGQLSMRAMLKFLTQRWAGFTSIVQATWETRAAVTNISPFNAYVKYNLTRWGIGDYPATTDPAAEVGTPSLTSTPLATAGVRSVEVSIDVDTFNSGWGVAIFRGLVTGVGVTRNELVQVIPMAGVSTITWLDFPLTPAIEQFYVMSGFTVDGVLGVPEAEVSATPTA